MCGIVGIISKRPSGFYMGDADMLENLLTLDYVRGKHATGAFGVHNSNQVSFQKIASHPLDLFACDDWKDFRSKISRSMHIVIGHNRRSTGGRSISENAHPFVQDNIILVHNGVIHSGVESKKKEVEVDSHKVCEAFANENYVDVVKKIQGAFAFVWYDTKTRMLHTLRNAERPLTIVETDDNYYLASEAWMVQGLLSRETGEGNKVRSSVMTEVGQLYTFQKGKPYTKVAAELAKEHTYETVWPTYPGRGGQRQMPPFNPAGVSQRQMSMVPNVLTRESRAGFVTDMTAASNDLIEMPQRPSREDFLKSLHETALEAPKRGQTVLFAVRTTQPQQGAGGSYRVIGQVCSSAHARADVSFISQDVDLFLAKPGDVYQGRITEVVWIAAGPSVQMADVKKPDRVQMIHESVPRIEWNYAVSHVKCKDCESALMMSKAQFTSLVWNTKDRKWVGTCPVCIAKKITDPAVRKKFITAIGGRVYDVNNAVQDGEPDSKSIVDVLGNPASPLDPRTSQLH